MTKGGWELPKGGWRMVKAPEERLRTAIPVALCLAFFAFSLLLEKITDYKLTVYGLMILFVVYYLPDGIWGFVRQALAAFGLGKVAAVVGARGDDAHVWSATAPTTNMTIATMMPMVACR